MISQRLTFSRYFLILILVLALVIPLPSTYAASFSSVKNLSNDGNASELPEVFASGNNVYVVWFDDTSNEIRFTNSTDAGVNFWAHEKIGDTATGGTEATKPSPQVVANGDNVYIAWQDNAQIKFVRSTNNGNTFGTVQVIGVASATSSTNELTLLNSTSTDAYLSWVDSSDNVLFVNSTDGTTFDDADSNSIADSFDAGNTGGTGNQQKVVRMAVSGNNVYLVWVDNTSLNFRHSTNNGDSFETVQTLDTLDVSVDSVAPDIAAQDSEVYVVWRDRSGSFPNFVGNLHFLKNTNSGAAGSWSATSTIGSGSSGASTGLTAKIGIGVGSHLYVLWNDDNSGVLDIKIAHSDSTTIGQEFVSATHSTTNLSNSAGTESVMPQIATLDDNVFAVWREKVNSTDYDILAQVSINNGSSFLTAPRNLPALTDGVQKFFASIPQIFASGSKAFVVWEEHDEKNTQPSEIRFVSVSPTAPINYNATNYRLGETAKITITDSDLNTNAGSQQEYDVTVKSTTDSTTGITVTVRETGVNTGVFEGTFTFSSSSSSGTVLKASAGDIITSTFGSTSGTANIYTRTVAFDGSSYVVGNFARVIVTDQNSNTAATAKDSVTVTLSARDSEFSTNLTLQETGVNTGVFGTTSDHSIILMKNDLRIPIDRTLTITETVSGNSADVNNPDKRTLTISSTTSAGNLSFDVVETGDNTNKFTGTLTISTAATGGSNIQVAACDILLILNPASLNERGLITPCSDTDKVALIVAVPTTVDTDRITASYQDATDSETVFYDTTLGGGGGGGLVRPSVVLNAVASIATQISSSGGSRDNSPPISTLDNVSKLKSVTVPDNIKSIIENQKPNVPIEPLENESFALPLTINEKGYPLGSNENTIVTNKIPVGESTKIKLVFYEQSELEHVSMYMNLRDGIRDDQSDTYIIYDKRNPMEIVDRNGFFESINVEMIEEGPYTKIAIFDIKFAKPMETSDLIYKSWDLQRRGATVEIHDALKVGETPEEEPEPTKIISEEKPVPKWIKSNAKWWSEGQIDDKTFTNGIGHLISEKIIDVPVGPNVSVSKDEDSEVQEEVIEEVKIPEWLKSNAMWWAEDLIDEDTFLSGIEYMVKNKIITIT